MGSWLCVRREIAEYMDGGRKLKRDLGAQTHDDLMA